MASCQLPDRVIAEVYALFHNLAINQGADSMIEIVRANETGKEDLLRDMHRFRARVFCDMLKWQVLVNDEGLEVDQFDLPDAIYLLALDEDRRVIGTWRLLSTSGPTMIRDVWPHYLETLPMPASPDVWEVSRFAVSPICQRADEIVSQSRRAIGEMFCALTEFCLSAGIRQVYTLYDERIARIIQRIDCQPSRISHLSPIDGRLSRIGVFDTDQDMLARLRKATGIHRAVVENIDVPAQHVARVIEREGNYVRHAAA